MEITTNVYEPDTKERRPIDVCQKPLKLAENRDQGEIVVSVRHVSKKFCRNLRRSMAYGILELSKNLLGIKPDSSILRKDEFWALNDVNFELRKGETLGVIGVNGSGKTTLLRLLTGIFPPDKGEIMIKGRVGALIAVGAGFHPHMTGEENIYLNGIILGMSRREVQEKFHNIVELAEIGDFLDAPVSTYSSGMRVRLGFSIAVHLEPDILLIDEVLAVGDITFRKKATEKILELKEKTSTIFVSHNMRQIYRICDRALLLNHGKIERIGMVDEVVTHYINENIRRTKANHNVKILNSINTLHNADVKFFNTNHEETRSFNFGEKVIVKICVSLAEQINDILCGIPIASVDGNIITVITAEDFPFNLYKGKNILESTIDAIQLVPGAYNVQVRFRLKYSNSVLIELDAGNVNVLETGGNNKPKVGFYREKASWRIYQ